MKTKLLLFATLSLFMTVALSAQEAKYEIKSAIITKSYEMMGQKHDVVHYFDNYGMLESSQAKMSLQGLPGVTQNIRTITKGDTIIAVNMTTKMGNRMVLPEKPINYLKLTPEIREKYKIKELEQEEVAGEMCKKYTVEVTQMGQTVNITTWIWKGIALKSITQSGGMTVMTEASTKIQENEAIDAEVFSIPDGITIQRM